MASNYSVLVGVELDTKNVQQQLNNSLKNLKVDLDADKAVKSMDSLTDSAENALLTFQVANEVFRTSVEIIGLFKLKMEASHESVKRMVFHLISLIEREGE